MSNYKGYTAARARANRRDYQKHSAARKAAAAARYRDKLGGKTKREWKELG